MHIPDGFLDPKTWAGLDVAAAAAVGVAVAQSRKRLQERQIPLLGVMAAFIFAAQMLNFPVLAGTSGHFAGGALAAILFGPWTGSLVMTIVLVVQCLLFQDGGLLALGANILNMGVIGVWVAWLSYRFLLSLGGEGRQGLAYFLAGWLSLVSAALACSLELAVSGVVPLTAVLPAMLGVHALIGVGEGLITTAVATRLVKAQPDLFPQNAKKVAYGEEGVRP